MENVLTKNLVNRYEARDLLGHGGMGTVIKAHDRTLNREVAIKQLSAALQQNDSAIDIFLTEARALASLSHLNLVNVYDIIEAQEGVAMIQEFVHGTTLEQEVEQRGALPEEKAILLAIQLTCVVGYLHHMNYLHRDLKPANIILQPDGYLRLVDFGLSRKFDRLLSRGTEVRGTPAYMAPEQIKSRDLTPCTDIYQIGVTLYEVLVGELPFETNGDTYALAYAHVNEKPKRVQAVRPEVSKAFSDVIYKCLKKKPKNRFENCQALLDALAPVYEDLFGHSLEESGFLVPFGEVGVGDVDASEGSFIPNTSGRYLAVPKHITKNRISALDTSNMKLPETPVERGFADESSELERVVDAARISSENLSVMEERLEQLEQAQNDKNKRMLGLLALVVVLVGALIVVVALNTGSDKPVATPPIDASSSVASTVVEPPSPPVSAPPVSAPTQPVVVPPVAEESPKPAQEPAAKKPAAEKPAQPDVSATPDVAPVVSPPKKKAPVKRAAKKTPAKRAAPKKASKPAPADPAPKKEPAKKKSGSYLDGFKTVDADDNRLDDDLKALSDDL